MRYNGFGRYPTQVLTPGVRLSGRQRVVLLTFPTVEDAEDWDAAPDDEALARVIVENGTRHDAQREDPC